MIPDVPKNGGIKLKYEAANLQGVGARERQEDAFTLANALDEQMYDRLGLMFAVCDGMGGMKDGKLASDTAISCLRDFFNNMDRYANIPMQLKNCLENASREVERAIDGEGGSTAVVGIILDEQLYFASVGDSFLYLYRNGGLYRLNRHHTVCHDLYMKNIRSGSTEAQSCREDPEAFALSQFLGVSELSDVDVSVRPLNLHKGDILLACSDGIGGVLDKNEIIEALGQSAPQSMCKTLEERIIEHSNPNQDNYTALVIECRTR